MSYEQRLMRWNGTAGPENDIEEFLMNDVVSISFEIERARHAELERVRSRLENAYELEVEAARALRERLFFDPSGPIGVYGTRSHDWRKCRTSWNGQAADPDHPAKIVGELKSTAMGCYFLLDCWGELREHLESGGIWLAPDLLKAARLLGRQPVDANSDRRVADIFACSHALFRAGEAFEQLNTDMSPLALETYVKGLRARWKDLVRSDERARARQILIGLVDQNIEEIGAILAEHEEESSERRDERIKALATRDSSREGEDNRRYLMRCRSGLDRGLGTYRKLRKDRFERAKRGADTREIYGRGGELLGSPEPRRPPAFGTKGARPWGQEIDAADVNACRGFVPAGCTDLLVEEIEGAADGERALSTLTTDGGQGENVTNEANFYENVISSQLKGCVQVTVDSGVGTALDSVTNEPNFGEPPESGAGLESDVSTGVEMLELGSECHDAIADSQVLGANTHGSEPRGLASKVHGRAGRRSGRKIKGESRRERKAKERRELERRARALINDPTRSGAEANALIDELRAASAQAFRDLMPVVRPRAP